MTAITERFRKNRTLAITLAVLLLLFAMAAQGMPAQDWVITTLRGLSVGALTFLVAAGPSIMLGLLDVLNFAHGELFMIGAYVGWTVYVRPDTFVDVLTPVLLIGAGLALIPVWKRVVAGLSLPGTAARAWPWVPLVAAGAGLAFGLARYPIGIWDLENYTQAPTSFSLALDTGLLQMPEPAVFEAPEIAEQLPFLAKFSDALNFATPRPTTAAGEQYATVSELYYTAVHDVLAGNKDAATAMEDLELALAGLGFELP